MRRERKGDVEVEQKLRQEIFQEQSTPMQSYFRPGQFNYAGIFVPRFVFQYPAAFFGQLIPGTPDRALHPG